MRIANRYHLEVLLGCGGMGEVWRATDEVLGREVAVKLLRPGGEDEEAAERFRREARAAAVVNNPHVVGVHDFGPDGDGYFLVMELVEGHTVANELRWRGRFSPSLAARVTAQAADGLAAAHQEGVVHRDVKPSNLLVTEDGTVKVSDFGIARFVGDRPDEPTPDGHILGTSYYVAPERARAEPAGPAADVYSLGCVLHQLLTGRPPFVGDSPTGVLHQHLHCPPQQIDPHPAFRHVLPRMLAKDPAERPAAADVASWCWQITLDDTLPADAPSLAREPEAAEALEAANTCSLAPSA